jgi:aspartate-semialdehyde dehydrogenase
MASATVTATAEQQRRYTVAVLGATGVVGRELIRILEGRSFPVERLVPLGSDRSVAGGKTVQFGVLFYFLEY